MFGASCRTPIYNKINARSFLPMGSKMISTTKTPPEGGVFVVLVFGFRRPLAERGFRPQAYFYVTRAEGKCKNNLMIF
jgi:hypothetical protein